MKKKVLMMLLAASMLAVTAAPALAEDTSEAAVSEEMTEETETFELNFEDYEPFYDGTWLAFEGGFSLYLPTDWNVLEISEEDAEDGVIFAVIADDESGWNMNMMYTAAGEEDEYTLADVADLLAQEENYTDIETAVINGIETLSLSTVDDTAVVLCFMDDIGGMYNMTITGDVNDDDFVGMAFTMMTSLSVTEE